MENPAATVVSAPFIPTGLAGLVAAQAAHQPDRPALVTPLGRWTYRQLADHTEALAAALPVAPGQDTVALAGPANDLALAAYAATARGLALWPQDPTSTDQWPARQALAGPRARLLAALPPVSTASAAPSAASSAARPATPPATPPADSTANAGTTTLASAALQHPTLVIATSGSEGEAKAVMLSAANLAAAAAASNAALPLGPGDVWLCCLPLFHIGGQSILWRCALAGATVQLHEGFAAPAVAEALARDGVTHLSLVPAMLAQLLDLGVPPLPGLRHVLVGGAALAAPLHARACAAGWPLRPSYGMSECAAQVATLLPGNPAPWREGQVGRPLAGNRISVEADGRLRLAGPQVMLGYLRPDGRLGHGLDNGGFLTSDLGTLDEAGHLTVLGRADDMLISGGKNIHPLEIEGRLAACPGIADLAVTGLPDPVWGQRIVALVAGPATPQQVEAWARQHLPGSLRPRAFVKVAALPRNAMGKLLRPALGALLVGEVA